MEEEPEILYTGMQVTLQVPITFILIHHFHEALGMAEVTVTVVTAVIIIDLLKDRYRLLLFLFVSL